MTCLWIGIESYILIPARKQLVEWWTMMVTMVPDWNPRTKEWVTRIIHILKIVLAIVFSCPLYFKQKEWLTHWGRETHICVGKLTIIASDNDLSPGRRQAIIWTNAGVLLIGPLGTNFNEILIKIQHIIQENAFIMSSAKWRPFCIGLNVLKSHLWYHVLLPIIFSKHV